MEPRRLKFKLVRVPVEEAGPQVAPEAPPARPEKRGLLRSLGGLLVGLDAHQAVLRKLTGPTGQLKSRWKVFGGELLSAADVLGQRLMPKASAHRVGRVSLGALAVLLLAFGPCLFFTGRSVASLVHRIQEAREKAAQDLDASRRARDERSRKPAAPPTSEGLHEAR